eukprot:2163639-Pleurochrysis_carterae.AAC.1
MSARWLEQMGDEYGMKAVRARRTQNALLAQRPGPASAADSSERQSNAGDGEDEYTAPEMN